MTSHQILSKFKFKMWLSSSRLIRDIACLIHKGPNNVHVHVQFNDLLNNFFFKRTWLIYQLLIKQLLKIYKNRLMQVTQHNTYTHLLYTHTHTVHILTQCINYPSFPAKLYLDDILDIDNPFLIHCFPSYIQKSYF